MERYGSVESSRVYMRVLEEYMENYGNVQLQQYLTTNHESREVLDQDITSVFTWPIHCLQPPRLVSLKSEMRGDHFLLANTTFLLPLVQIFWLCSKMSRTGWLPLYPSSV